MPVKMIVTDLDGTLVRGDFTISPENASAVHEAAARGIVVAVATGRMHRSAMRYVDALGLTAPVITYNGALLRTTHGETLHSASLAPDAAEEVLRYVFERKWYVQLYSGDMLYYVRRVQAARAYEKASGVPGEAVGEAGLLARTQDVSKLLLVMQEPDDIGPAIEALSEKFHGRAEFMQSAAAYIEVVRPGVSKGGAMMRLAGMKGIKVDEIMALGDSGNDVSMLRAAGLGVAMGGAPDSVKAAADAVTLGCEEDGFAAALRKYALGE